MTSEFIPNSFQIPNAYVDKYLDLLTPEEWKVLTYLARRIFGFQKREDRVALSQFSHGLTSRNGERLDGGTGLSESAIKKALDALVAFNLVIRVDENDPVKNEGINWALQLESSQVNLESMQERFDARKARYSQVCAVARNAKENEPALSDSPTTVTQTHPCETTPPPLCETTPPPLCGTTPPPLCETGTQYTVLNTVLNTEGNTDTAIEREKEILDYLNAKKEQALKDRPPVKRKMTGIGEKKGDLLDGILAFSATELDLSDYQEQHWPYLREFYKHWKIKPPARREDKNGWSRWNKEIDTLRKVYGEDAFLLMERLFKKWVADGRRWTVASPGSLMNSMASEKGIYLQEQEERNKPAGIDTYDPDVVADFQRQLMQVRQSQTL